MEDTESGGAPANEPEREKVVATTSERDTKLKGGAKHVKELDKLGKELEKNVKGWRKFGQLTVPFIIGSAVSYIALVEFWQDEKDDAIANDARTILDSYGFSAKTITRLRKVAEFAGDLQDVASDLPASLESLYELARATEHGLDLQKAMSAEGTTVKDKDGKDMLVRLTAESGLEEVRKIRKATGGGQDQSKKTENAAKKKADAEAKRLAAIAASTPRTTPEQQNEELEAIERDLDSGQPHPDHAAPPGVVPIFKDGMPVQTPVTPIPTAEYRLEPFTVTYETATRLLQSWGENIAKVRLSPIFMDDDGFLTCVVKFEREAIPAEVLTEMEIVEGQNEATV